MKKQLLNAIAKRLKSELNADEIASEFGKLNYIARFRNQFNNPDEIIPSPAIAIEFPETLFENAAKQQQKAIFTINIHCHIRNLRKQKLKGDIVEGTEELAYQEKIHQALHGWAPECFTTLLRVSEDEDVNYDFGITDSITYETTAIDDSADKRKNYDEVTPDLDVEENVINPPEPESPYQVEV